MLLSLTGCNTQQECDGDSDCAVGERCLKSTTGWVEASFCGPYGEMPDLNEQVDTAELIDQQPDEEEDIDLGCAYTCEASLPGSATCLRDLQTVCELECEGTLADCDGDLQTGCEVDTATDSLHCGGCANACEPILSALNTEGSCQASACVPAACLRDSYDIDEDLSDGCEVRVDVDNIATYTPALGGQIGLVDRMGAGTLVERRDISQTTVQWIPDGWSGEATEIETLVMVDTDGFPIEADLSVMAAYAPQDGEQAFAVLTSASSGMRYWIMRSAESPLHIMEAENCYNACTADVTGLLRSLRGSLVAGYILTIDGFVLEEIGDESISSEPELIGDGLYRATSRLVDEALSNDSMEIKLLKTRNGIFGLSASENKVHQMEFSTEIIYRDIDTDATQFSSELETWLGLDGVSRGFAYINNDGDVDFLEYIYDEISNSLSLIERKHNVLRSRFPVQPEKLTAIGTDSLIATAGSELYLVNANNTEVQEVRLPGVAGELGDTDFDGGHLAFNNATNSITVIPIHHLDEAATSE